MKHIQTGLLMRNIVLALRNEKKKNQTQNVTLWLQNVTLFELLKFEKN